MTKTEYNQAIDALYAAAVADILPLREADRAIAALREVEGLRSTAQKIRQLAINCEASGDEVQIEDLRELLP